MARLAKVSHSSAAKQLAERDVIFSALVDAVGMPRLRPPHQTHFAALVRSIVYQQLAGNAARAIHERLIEAVTGDVSPAALRMLPAERFRQAGISANKYASISDLATKVDDGDVDLSSARISRMNDELIIEMLSTVRGIGRWTAQMFLIFQLRRLDVWPAGDLGVRRGFSLAYSIELPSEKALEPLGDAFSPYRSVAAWYCWRACELYGRAASSTGTQQSSNSRG